MVNLHDPFITTLNNLGLAQYQNRVMNKAKEISDLIAIKASLLGRSLDDQTKTTICIDIACEIMHIPFDSDAAIRMSPAVKKSEYKKTKNSFLKLISLNKLVDVSSLLLKLGVCNSSVEKQAKEIFALCQRHETSDHPQYVALSCYFACNMHKQKVLKKQFIAASNLRPFQWTKLEKSFAGLVTQASKEDSKAASALEDSEEASYRSNGQHQKEKRKLNTEQELEDYDVWKIRTLKEAYAAINAKKAAKS